MHPAELRVPDAAQSVTLNGQPISVRTAIGAGDQVAQPLSAERSISFRSPPWLLRRPRPGRTRCTCVRRNLSLTATGFSSAGDDWLTDSYRHSPMSKLWPRPSLFA